MGGVRRVPRMSNVTTYAPPAISEPVLTANWTIQKTTTYVEVTPATGPVAWGGTLTALDRTMVSTGSGYAALGALITWVHKPDSIAGVVIKIQPTYLTTEIPFLEMWTLDGAVWTKRNRQALSSQVRSGETRVFDLTSTIYAADTVDAIWITLVPSGTETLTWLVLHTYGVCDNDSVTAKCRPGDLPEDCGIIECDADVETWLSVTSCGAVSLAPLRVLVPMARSNLVQELVTKSMTYYATSVNFRHNHISPNPKYVSMYFPDLIAGTSVTVDVVNSHGIPLAATDIGAAVTSQTISAAGYLEWWVVPGGGFAPTNNPTLFDNLPPIDLTPDMEFLFTLHVDTTVVSMLAQLRFSFSNAIGYVGEPA